MFPCTIEAVDVLMVLGEMPKPYRDGRDNNKSGITTESILSRINEQI
jgi:hypothetical protein